MKKTFLITSLVLTLTACSAKTPSQALEAPLTPATTVPTVTPVPFSSATEQPVVASGVVVPGQWAAVDFSATGVVSAVVVQPGRPVAAGDLVIQLNTRTSELALQVAQQEVLAQQATLDQGEVQARTSLQQAGWELEQAQWELTQLKVQDHAPIVAAARARVKALELQQAQARAQGPGPDLTLAQVRLTRVLALRDYAQTEYQEALDRLWEEQEVRDRYAALLQQAEWELAQARAQFDGAQNNQQAHTIGLSALSAQLDVAQAELDEALNAQESYSATLESLAAEVAYLEEQLDQDFDPLTREAEARLKQAELSVRQIELQIAQAQLHSPIDGTIVAVHTRPGQAVVPNQPALTVADLDHWVLETTALSQFDLARVEIGQPATVNLDAFPDVTLTGHVNEIRLQTLEEDEVTYIVCIALDVPEPSRSRLRWGMTGVVEITLSK